MKWIVCFVLATGINIILLHGAGMDFWPRVIAALCLVWPFLELWDRVTRQGHPTGVDEQ